MSKFLISDIATILAEKHGMSIKDAESFVSCLFDVVNEGLRYEKLVKIKGLGTFKVIDVKERASVDVNTGERIVIDGRSKITFTPDSVLKELVNKPFSQFETVVLNDGVTFDDINSSEDKDDDQQSESETLSVDTIIPETPQEQEKTDVVEHITMESVDESDNQSQQEHSPEESNVQLAAPVVPLAEEPAEDTKAEDEKPDDNSEETSQERDNVELTKDGVAVIAETDEPGDSEENYDAEPRKGVSVIAFVISSLLIAIVFFSGGYFVGTKYNVFENSETAVVQPKVRKAAPSLDSSSVAKKTVPLMADSVSTEKQVADTAAVKSAKDQEMEFSEQFDKDNTEVRLGAYRIVGVECEVTVLKGQTLSSISKAYLGKGMECYVTALNGVSEVKEGDVLKIPKLKIRKRK